MSKEFKSFFKKVGGNEGGKCHYPTRLDTYGCGCSNECLYCYSKALLSFRGLWHPEDPAVADIGAVRRVIEKKLRPGDVVRLGGMTDCFQPKEKVERITYKTIEALNERRVGYLIVTKSEIVADDDYLKLMDKDLAHIQVSVTSTDDAFCATYEKATPPSRRLQAIEKLQAEGFDVALRLSPFVPEFVGKGVLDLNAIGAVKCDKILVEFLRVNSWVKKWFDIDFSAYTLKQSGYEHLPLEDKLTWLTELVKAWKEPKQLSVCDDVDEHYEFFRDNINRDPEDCCNLRKGGSGC